MDLSTLFNDLTPERIVAILANHPPWWVYVLLGLIPLSILYVIRECWCWFFKINQLRDSLRRIERLLEQSLQRQTQVPARRPAPERVPDKLSDKTIEH
jgi:hypothetical protein